MADTVKLPVLGPTNKRWVWVGGALIAGIVGYAWFQRTRGEPAPELTEEDIPQDREPPATVVGTEDFTSPEAAAIINTNAEWYTAAVEYLVGTGGFDFAFTTITLGKFLARQRLTEQEANLVQAAKGAVGEPPLGGPWPINRTTAPGPTTPTSGRLATPSGFRLITNRRGYFEFTWGRVSGASHYLVRKERPGADVTSPTVTNKKTGRHASPKNTVFFYRVRAQAPGRTASNWSEPFTFRAA
jgi:3',5'-cyclic AMP phosphodiesterase CpdA